MDTEGESRYKDIKRLRYGILSVLGFCFLGMAVLGTTAIALCFMLFYLFPEKADNDAIVLRAYVGVIGAASLGWGLGLFWSLAYEGRVRIKTVRR